ncbi:hypothetical protein BC937DRAFT_95188 [Endogone sp. FLAS-F59071]|nr:hypothetical protein BC937DRAFT_95188 [Endogone sp. FLAS-F59071]|eukprot:RUS20445.1 hypothetical protein BC937DRAFT_95188 [Endogone sp. FLAS-F59071]
MRFLSTAGIDMADPRSTLDLGNLPRWSHCSEVRPQLLYHSEQAQKKGQFPIPIGLIGKMVPVNLDDVSRGILK